jgi:hypothetical protein
MSRQINGGIVKEGFMKVKQEVQKMENVGEVDDVAGGARYIGNHLNAQPFMCVGML